jgi:superfamily I DNA and RNA helicase
MLQLIGHIEDDVKESIITSTLNSIRITFPEIIGEAYIGYPIYIDPIYDRNVVVDLTIISNIGVFVINILKKAVINYKTIQDEIYLKLESKFKKQGYLLNGRDLTFVYTTITYSVEPLEPMTDAIIVFNVQELIKAIKANAQCFESALRNKILSAIQEAYGINRRVERNDVRQGTKAYLINKMNDLIERYDNKQMEAILSDVSGIQRIRGMAGSGKTIVLARKAVELHTTHPDWIIVVTYSTRSLRKYLTSLISNFYAVKNDGAKFDETKLRIMHAWGSSNSPGIYYEACISTGNQPLTYGEAKSRFGKKHTFSKVCAELLDKQTDFPQIFNCVLIDEAQDFDKSFLLLCLKLLDKHERLAYAYDELQDLADVSMPPPYEIFGKQIKHDTPLTVCYRNQCQTIVTAHALGLGLYSNNGLIQFPSSVDVWEAIGYTSDSPIVQGKEVTLYRTRETSPQFLETNDEDVVKIIPCDDFQGMISLLIAYVQNDIYSDNLLPSQIMVVDMDSLSYADNLMRIRKKLHGSDTCDENVVKFHQAGALSPEDFFRTDSVVYTSVFRAKGNESFMVYIVNAQNCINSLVSTRDRNSLFTAITRSKGWVRVLGYGTGILELLDEFKKIESNEYRLRFTYPTDSDLRRITLNSRDIKHSEQETLDSARLLFSRLARSGHYTKEQLLQALLGVTTLEQLDEIISDRKK